MCLYLEPLKLNGSTVRCFKVEDAERCSKCNIFGLFGAPLGCYRSMLYIFRKLLFELMLSSNWHIVTLRLIVFEIFGVKLPKFKPKIWHRRRDIWPGTKKKQKANLISNLMSDRLHTGVAFVDNRCTKGSRTFVDGFSRVFQRLVDKLSGQSHTASFSISKFVLSPYSISWNWVQLGLGSAEKVTFSNLPPTRKEFRDQKLNFSIAANFDIFL